MTTRLGPSLAPSILLILCVAGCSGGGDGEDGGAGTGANVDGPRGGTGGDAGGGAGAGGSAGASGEGGGSGPAGDDGGAAGAPFTPVPIAELPEVFALAICDALEGCLGEAALRELTDREECSARVTAELRATEFHYMNDALDAGRVLYDSSQLSACLDGVRELGCDVLTDSYPEPCVQVLAGNVPLGEPCRVSAECQGTAFCAGAAAGQCPSVCTELLDEGAACTGDNECGDEMLCLAGECSRLSLAGEACAGDSGRVCALGFTCMGATDTEAGECAENASVQVGDENDPCEPGGTLCKEGLSCVFDGVAGFHCRPYVSAGAACQLGLPGQCPREQYCDAANVTAEGTCRALPGDGDPCVLTGLCAPGHVCIADGDASVCRQVRDNGAECSAGAECRSGRCEAGTCEPPPVCAD